MGLDASGRREEPIGDEVAIQPSTSAATPLAWRGLTVRNENHPPKPFVDARHRCSPAQEESKDLKKALALNEVDRGSLRRRPGLGFETWQHRYVAVRSAGADGGHLARVVDSTSRSVMPSADAPSSPRMARR
jgi:hypothetical protein